MAEDRAQEAFDHLQAAALELIAALRAVLDIAEEAVREPHGVADIVASTARAAAHAAATLGAQPGAHADFLRSRGAADGAGVAATDEAGGAATDEAGVAVRDRPRRRGVEHITIA